jgi:serine/threonine protein phosphatase PrpC
MTTMLTFKGVTHPGRVRKANEDGFCHDARLGLFLVADGLGGHNSGEIASRMALESISSFIRRTKDDEEFTWPFGVDTYLSYDANRVRTALRLANRRVFQASEEGVEYAGMGTTIVTALVTGSTLTFATVGDSRLYSFSGATLSRLTVDDSWLATLSAQDPGLDPAQLERHPLRHVITKAIGTLADTEVDIHERALTSGEMLLLCSDGLHDMLTDDDISHELAAGASIDDTAERLVQHALEAGGRDNITVLLVRYDA